MNGAEMDNREPHIGENGAVWSRHQRQTVEYESRFDRRRAEATQLIIEGLKEEMPELDIPDNIVRGEE